MTSTMTREEARPQTRGDDFTELGGSAHTRPSRVAVLAAFAAGTMGLLLLTPLIALGAHQRASSVPDVNPTVVADSDPAPVPTEPAPVTLPPVTLPPVTAPPEPAPIPAPEPLTPVPAPPPPGPDITVPGPVPEITLAAPPTIPTLTLPIVGPVRR